MRGLKSEVRAARLRERRAVIEEYEGGGSRALAMAGALRVIQACSKNRSRQNQSPALGSRKHRREDVLEINSLGSVRRLQTAKHNSGNEQIEQISPARTVESSPHGGNQSYLRGGACHEHSSGGRRGWSSATISSPFGVNAEFAVSGCVCERVVSLYSSLSRVALLSIRARPILFQLPE